MGNLLNDRERKYFDSINIEVLKLAGAEDVTLWKFAKVPYNPDPTKPLPQDCLYNEPGEASQVVDGKRKGNYTPYKVLALFEKPMIEYFGTDEGLEKSYDVRIYFSAKNLENQKVPQNEYYERISVGDIVEFFSKTVNARVYYDVKNVEYDPIHDSKTKVQYICEAVRNTTFVPERKIPNEP